jgi:hypothetical protein
MLDTLVQPTDLRSTPSHVIGPTWQIRKDGEWHLPKKSLGWEVINWMTENLKAPEGEEDEPFMPTFEQTRFLLWWYAVDGRGRYAYRSGVLRRMKGWGKDPLVAAMSLAELCGPVAFSHFDEDGDPVGKPRMNAWIQVAAVSMEQTENTFSMFPQLATDQLIKDHKLEILKTMVYARGGRKIQAVTSNPKSLEGKRPTFVIMNETQWWVDSNAGSAMYNVINGNVVKRAGMGSRYIAICNAHVPGQNSVGEKMWDAYRAVESGQAVDTGLLYDALEAPANTPVSEIPPEDIDPEGFLDGIEKLWAGLEVCRGDSHWLDIESIIQSILDTNNPISESRRMFLNQINAAEDAWMTTQLWESIRVEGTTLQAGDQVTLGFDGSKSNDYTALVACRVSDGFLQVLRIWNPEDFYGQVPRDQVDAVVRWAFSHFNVIGFRADVKEFESYIATWTSEFGKKLKVKASPGKPIEFDMRGQTKKFAFDCEKFLDAVVEGAICHDGDKILGVHILNAHRHPTKFDAISIRKASKDSSRKIDAAVAAVLAFGIRQEFLMTKGNRGGDTGVLL